jgi:flagellar biosynthesis protein FliQ
VLPQFNEQYELIMPKSVAIVCILVNSVSFLLDMLSGYFYLLFDDVSGWSTRLQPAPSESMQTLSLEVN